MVKSPEFTMVRAPNPLPDAMVTKALLVLLNVMARLPMSAKPLVFAVIAPEMVMAAVVLPILDALPNETAPTYAAAVPLEFVSAPAPLIPAPLSVKASALLTF